MTNKEVQNITLESLRDWFKKEKWVRISSSGDIAGDCGTSKNKKNPDRCLPKAKAQSLTKGQRAATAAKKKRAGSKGKTVVKNTKAAKVTRETANPQDGKAAPYGSGYKPTKKMKEEKNISKKQVVKIKDMIKSLKKSSKGHAGQAEYLTNLVKETFKEALKATKDETKEAPAGHYFTKSGNLVKGTMSADAKERGARKSDPKDNTRSKVPKVTQYKEVKRPSIQGIKRKIRRAITKEDIENLVTGTIAEMQNENTLEEKDDRCTRLAKSKYDTWPSAYASGAVVRCRKGKIWKKK
jgi:hypothetical protein